VDLEVSANSMARFTSSPETVTWNATVYAPVPMRFSSEETLADGTLPGLTIDVANIGGNVMRYVKDNDLSFNNVTIRLVEGSLVSSGDDIRTTLQILGATFANEGARFSLGLGFTYDSEGPLRTYNRVEYPSIPISFSKFALI
jgi:hypothetical protein